MPACGSPVARQLRVSSTNALQTQTISVSVTLQGQGNENALGFTVAFDPEALRFAGLSAGADAAGVHFIGNTNSAAVGRVGVALAWPPGVTPSAGPLELTRLELRTTENVAGPQPVSLTDQVVTRCASDAVRCRTAAQF